MSTAQWYLNRLRCMPPREIGFRVLRELAVRAEQLGLVRYREAAPDLSRGSACWLQPPDEVDRDRYLAAAQRIMAGRFDVFALRDVALGTPPGWNRDPKTGTEAPLVFGKLLDYRDPRLVGDIKYLWEPNRHLQLVTLAQAYAISGDTCYSRALFGLLDSWFKACPYGLGANWSSALEPAMRLINWSLAWQLLGGACSAAFADPDSSATRDLWLRSIRQHMHFVRGFLSRHSSANNHLIGEATGVFIAACTWPHWPEAAQWLGETHALVRREALLQNAPDGTNREQATGYQLFVLELLLLAWLTGRANGVGFPAEFTTRLTAMLEYLASIMDAGGHLPMFGDSDDGAVVCLSQQPDFHAARSLLATGAVLFRRADFAAKAGQLDDKTRWLLGPAAATAFASLPIQDAQLPPRRQFAHGGRYVLGCDFESEREIRLVASAGPLGYGDLAAHGHADALSFTLSCGGHEVLVDPGTCTYRPDGPWREYFRGTAAHNTLRIDGLDQSQSGGNFLWLRKARAACSNWLPDPEADLFEGWHDGYTTLPDPVVHRRRIVLEKAVRRIVITDWLEMAGSHLVELFFHCSEQQLARLDGMSCDLTGPAGHVHLRLPQREGAQAQIRCGQLQPPLGWISRCFDHRAPAPTLHWQADLAGPAELTTIIQL